MKKIKRFTAWLICGALLLIGIAVTTTPAQASIVSHNLAIKASNKNDRSGIAVCSHWGASNGEKSGTTCSINGSETKYKFLDNGKWTNQSPINWKDTDGYYVPKGCRMREDVAGVDLKLVGGYHKKALWHKISPRITGTGIDHTRKLYLQCK